MRITCPTHRSCRLARVVSMLLELVRCRMSVWGILSFHVTPGMRWRQLMWKPNMPAVGSPSFCTKQQGRNAYCLVDGRFGEGMEIFINKDSRSKEEEPRFMRAWISSSISHLLPRWELECFQGSRNAEQPLLVSHGHGVWGWGPWSVQWSLSFGC